MAVSNNLLGMMTAMLTHFRRVSSRSRLLAPIYMTNARNILLIKTSSLGDVLHNLPAVTDICQHFPDAKIDWVVEESFAALPALHPRVSNIIPVAIRRWRKSWWASRAEMKMVCQRLHQEPYELVLDTQGLLKSALITHYVPSPRYGYDWQSAREPIASLFYDHKFSVSKSLHAVERNRQLAGLVLGYTPHGLPDYGIRAPSLNLPWLNSAQPYIALLHATSRDDKLWDEASWIDLGTQLASKGYQLILPWGSAKEQARSERLAGKIPSAISPPRLSLTEAAALLGNARAVIGVDTGLSHLAAALNVPTVGIYTATDPSLTGLYAGSNAVNLGCKQRSPSVAEVLITLNKLLANV
jgi:heptosyltransferase-1